MAPVAFERAWRNHHWNWRDWYESTPVRQSVLAHIAGFCGAVYTYKELAHTWKVPDETLQRWAITEYEWLKLGMIYALNCRWDDFWEWDQPTIEYCNAKGFGCPTPSMEVQ